MTYVEWPSYANEGMTVGIVNNASLSNALNKSSAGKKIHFKAVSVLKLSDVKNIDGCDVLFLPRKSTTLAAQLTEQASKHHILVITEDKSDAVKGAGVNFKEEKGKLRFELYMTALSEARLKVSEQLKRFAIVKS